MEGGLDDGNYSNLQYFFGECIQKISQIHKSFNLIQHIQTGAFLERHLGHRVGISAFRIHLGLKSLA